MKIVSYGQNGAYIDLDIAGSPDRAARTHALAASLRAAFPAADVVAGAGTVAVFGLPLGPVRDAALRAAGDAPPPPASVRSHEIDVIYDGPDLDDIAARLGLTRGAVIDLHAGREYTVELLGFLPGFAYMGPVDPRLLVARRAQPRPRVSPQSVALAGDFTGIYPLSSPGGWNLLGRSLGPLPFDPNDKAPFLFAPGDRVRFRPAPPAAISERPTPPMQEAHVEDGFFFDDRPTFVDDGPALVIGRQPGPATLQDAGRPGLLGLGMPPSGPLDPRLFSATNRALGNPPGTTAIELLGGSLEVRARGEVTISVDACAPQILREREELRIGPGKGSVRYIAVAGGIDVPPVIGSTATLISAGIGGANGEFFRRGLTLRVGSPAENAAPLPLEASPVSVGSEPILIDPGPHLDRFPDGAFERLLSGEWRASRLTDRTGQRLEGGSVPRLGPDLAGPVPMRRGAIQITTDGTPIILGPDHPTTGGYPVLAVVRAESFGALAQKRPGEPVQFRRA